ncbi:MAG: signal peptidase I [Clostridia bacterium]|nr:signal peptidase I [Clostridia bacterium]
MGKIIGSVVTGLVVALVLLCLGSVVFTKYALKQPASVFGYRLVKIVTDSMSPTIEVGQYILVKRAVGTEVKEGDIVVHVPEYGDFAGYTMTHRCVKEAYYDEELGRTCIQTKGDKAGATVDKPVPIENVQSVYIRTMHLSKFFDFVTSIWGIIILVAIPSLVGIILQIVAMVRSLNKPKEEPEGESEEERKQRLAEDAIKEFQEQQKVLEFIRSRKGEEAPKPMSVQDKIMAFIKERQAQKAAQDGAQNAPQETSSNAGQDE